MKESIFKPQNFYILAALKIHFYNAKSTTIHLHSTYFYNGEFLTGIVSSKNLHKYRHNIPVMCL